MRTPTWAVNTIEHTSSGDFLVGWALLDKRGGNAGLGFQIGPRVASSPLVGVDRPDAPRPSGLAAGDPNPLGFRVEVTGEEIAAASWTSPLEFAVRRKGVSLDELSYVFPGRAGPIPQAAHRLRVAGNDDRDAFLIEGATAFRTIDRVCQRWLLRSLTTAGTVVDWGIGCGRFARYLEPFAAGGVELIGLDVDPVNVEWCAENLAWASVHRIDGRPPTPLADATADLVVGISVMTHLRPELEAVWLAELSRFTKSGGYLLLTTLGDANFARSGLGAGEYAALQAAGTLDVGYNDGIDGAVADDPEYYRNVFHTEAHVRSVWGEFFDVVAFEPACIGNHQDLYVLRRP